LRLPEGYEGVVLVNTDRIVQAEADDGEDGEEDAEEEKVVETKVVEEVGTFEGIEVWGHETVMDEEDPYVRGVEEWISFSRAIHEFGNEKEGK
jgi:ribonuclease H2 subunit C